MYYVLHLLVFDYLATNIKKLYLSADSEPKSLLNVSFSSLIIPHKRESLTCLERQMSR